MELTEIKQKRESLESQLSEMLTAFENETGMTISWIDTMHVGPDTDNRILSVKISARI